jgi:hypothetical protein
MIYCWVILIVFHNADATSSIILEQETDSNGSVCKRGWQFGERCPDVRIYSVFRVTSNKEIKQT